MKKYWNSGDQKKQQQQSIEGDHIENESVNYGIYVEYFGLK